MNSQVIVLNADFSFLNIVSVERAFLYIEKGKVQVEKYSENVIFTFTRSYKIPRVVRFVNMVTQIFKKKIPWSRRNVLVRDNYTCQYCRKKSKKLTIDHVKPKSRGGKNTFENTVAACFECNNAMKGDKTPEEAGMKLIRRPATPTVSEFARMMATSLSITDIMEELGYGS